MEIKIESLSKPVIDLQATGEKIKQLRILKGLSVHDLQILLDFEYPQAIYLWEAGKPFPPIENLMLISQIFIVDILEIVVRKQV
jgi:transcriptional regulator with XRE-family HTH domain